MKRYLPLLLILNTPYTLAVPVVPNFSSGTMSAVTRTTQNVTETIVSTDFNTGHTYSINGTNLTIDGSTLSPPPTETVQTINGVSYTWTGADLTNKPNVTIANPGQSFQYVESYIGPGLSNQTRIDRVTILESVTETTSVFSQ
tara:strand:- start:233 stop:661 length:429 start_codon:yes stop_codon:yes gene_type:complete